mmetsp:Transcript_71209/g.141200  ORF Transcript_71209/g.141200 Transcript_71209/m.141200 type:complete len:205 (-) Transcript_71209:258-872(-)
MREEGGGKHGDEDEDRGVEQWTCSTRCCEEWPCRLTDHRAELTAHCVGAVEEAEHDEERRVERPSRADDGSDREGGEVAQQRERQQHERREQHDPDIATAQHAGSAGERRYRGKRVAENNRVAEPANICLEGDGERWDEGEPLAKDLGPCVAVRVGTHLVTHTCNQREGVAGDSAEEEQKGKCRHYSDWRRREGSNAGCKSEHS